MAERSFRIGVATLLLAFAAGAAGAADPRADEQQIRALDEQWVAAVARKDAVATAAFYAEDGAILPANAPMAKGREAIAAVW
jgi:ketosteroid isomerase-like protein